MILPEPAQKRIVLAGRVFVPVGESTIEHDTEVMRLLRAAGLEAAFAAGGEDFAWHALGALVESRTLLPLVACLIVPEAHAPRRPGRFGRWLERVGLVQTSAVRGGWSPEVAAETAAFLGQLDEPADKETVYGLVALLLLPFVNGALRSWRPSPRSSPGTTAAAAPDGSGPSAAATSDAGASSSASSPIVTPADSSGWHGGRSRRPS